MILSKSCKADANCGFVNLLLFGACILKKNKKAKFHPKRFLFKEHTYSEDE